MSFRFPYVAVDIETTGLDVQRSHVLQLAAIYDDGRPLEELSTFNQVIKWRTITYGEEYAMNMNRRLLERAFRDEDVVSPAGAAMMFGDWLGTFRTEMVWGREGHEFTAAGKNLAAFDVPVLTNRTNNFPWKVWFGRRVLDPGSMWTEDFDHVPSLDEINKYLRRKSVTHNALDDCWDVVHAVRYKWGAR